MLSTASKVTSEHLRRLAYLYVRQSSLQQVHDHRESTARQYELKRRAQALGWATDQIVVIDEDLGLSGASAAERSGFQRLVAEVGLGRVGLVMGLEVSRLARNSTDWHRLLEICALAETLILDEDGIYDPSHFNDRLLLGLKGTMSEAELHVLRARLLGGQLNKARRGELWMRPPIGFVYEACTQRLELDPDAQIQSTVRLLFETLRRTGSAGQVVRHFARDGILWPRRLYTGGRAGELVFAPLDHSRVLGILHNPRYAGAFVYGRTRQRKVVVAGQTRYRRLPRPEWKVFLPNVAAGYITWEEFQANQARLLENANGYGPDRRRSPAREGVALLQGLVLCGRCGDRMTVRYAVRQGHPVPDYTCQRRGIARAQGPCQIVPGTGLDEAVAQAVLERPRPLGAPDLRRTPPAIVEMIRALATEQADRQIADTLNARWLRSGTGQSFTRLRVRVIREAYGISSLAEHLRAAGWLTSAEIATQLGVHHTTAKRFACEGVLHGRRADDAGRILFEPPVGPLPRPHPGKRFRDRRRYAQCAPAMRKGAAV